MTIEALSVWKDEWENLPKVADDTWKQNLADYISARLDGLLWFQTYEPAPGHFDFGFLQAPFISALAGVDFSNPIGIQQIAAGMAAAITASTDLVAVGSSIGPAGNPATTYSAVTSTVFDSASITLMQNKILTIDPTPVASAQDSDFPVKLREGVLLLTATISGTNSVAPTPSALTDPARGVE
jgi:hypothetical protein